MQTHQAHTHIHSHAHIKTHSAASTEEANMVEIHEGQRGSGCPHHKQEPLQVSFLPLCSFNLTYSPLYKLNSRAQTHSGSRFLVCLINENTLRLWIQLAVYG